MNEDGNFKLEIALGNEAMQTGSDVAEALRFIAGRVEANDPIRSASGMIQDNNGNRVGTYWYEEA